MHLNLFAPLWFEILVVALLAGRSRFDQVRAVGRALNRRRGQVEITVLLALGIGLVALLRAEQISLAAVLLVLMVLADTAWVHRRPVAGTPDPPQGSAV